MEVMTVRLQFSQVNSCSIYLGIVSADLRRPHAWQQKGETAQRSWLEGYSKFRQIEPRGFEAPEETSAQTVVLTVVAPGTAASTRAFVLMDAQVIILMPRSRSDLCPFRKEGAFLFVIDKNTKKELNTRVLSSFTLV
jgi:hypothetical protein